MSALPTLLLRGLVASIGLLAAPQALAAALTLPGAGAVAGIETIPSRDGFDQRIRLSGGDGANSARIVVHNATADLLLAFPNDMSKPSAGNIQSALHARFPGQTLTVLRQPRRNAYGPVGMAVGADCVFAWQWIELGPSTASGYGRSTEARGAASIRIRLCRTEQASLPDLIAAIERMRLDLTAKPPTGPVIERVRVVAERRPSPVYRPPRPVRKKPEMAERKPAPAVAEPVATVEPPARPYTPPPAAASQPRPTPIGSSSQRFITDAMPGSEDPGRGRAAARPANPQTAYGDRFTPSLPSQAFRPPETR